MTKIRTSASASLVASTPETDDLDVATAQLIAQLLLEDLSDITQRRKGKARADAPLSDEELAFRLQCDICEDTARTANDYAMAKSINDAIDSDHRFLRAVSITEQAAADDRRAAQLLESQGQLPPPSNAQRLVEDPGLFTGLSETASTKISSSLKGKERATERVENPPLVQSSPRVECASCGDQVKARASLKAPCGHSYCGTCVADLIQAATRDESLYPPRCCNQPFAITSVVPFVSPKLLQTFNAKRVELDIPAAQRVYCPIATCSAFLGSSKTTQEDMRCGKCSIFVCMSAPLNSSMDNSLAGSVIYQCVCAVHEIGCNIFG